MIPKSFGRISLHGLLGGSLAAALVLAGGLLAACGSSDSSASSKAEVKQTCKQIEAVLSDGPEPGADPVGHAQAQILPLRQLHTSDGRLQKAIDGLASAYAAYSAANGDSHSAKSVVSAAVGRVNAICPGVAS